MATIIKNLDGASFVDMEPNRRLVGLAIPVLHVDAPHPQSGTTGHIVLSVNQPPPVPENGFYTCKRLPESGWEVTDLRSGEIIRYADGCVIASAVFAERAKKGTL